MNDFWKLKNKGYFHCFHETNNYSYENPVLKKIFDENVLKFLKSVRYLSSLTIVVFSIKCVTIVKMMSSILFEQLQIFVYWLIATFSTQVFCNANNFFNLFFKFFQGYFKLRKKLSQKENTKVGQVFQKDLLQKNIQ